MICRVGARPVWNALIRRDSLKDRYIQGITRQAIPTTTMNNQLPPVSITLTRGLPKKMPAWMSSHSEAFRLRPARSSFCDNDSSKSRCSMMRSAIATAESLSC